MADFCKQCLLVYFDEDLGDLRGLITEEEFKAGQGAVVTCEGCGDTLVDHEGRCVARWCPEHGKVAL